MKKLSILGLVLFAASAVTAAFIPNKQTADNGKLQPALTSANQNTCQVAQSGLDCVITEGTSTSAANPGTSIDAAGSSAAGANTSA